MKIIILQGPSGAGKSTYTKKLPGKVYVCSADDYFLKDGEYLFDSSQLNKAHAWCLNKFLITISGDDHKEWTVVVDNTNTTALEIAPYYQAALAFGHDVEIVSINVDPGIAWERNVHKVPRGTVQSQAARIKESTKDFPRWWKRTVFTPTQS